MLEYFATLYDLPRDRAQRRIGDLIEWLGMGPYLRLRCGALSTAKTAREHCPRAHRDPPILVLDEPRSGWTC